VRAGSQIAGAGLAGASVTAGPPVRL